MDHPSEIAREKHCGRVAGAGSKNLIAPDPSKDGLSGTGNQWVRLVVASIYHLRSMVVYTSNANTPGATNRGPQVSTHTPTNAAPVSAKKRALSLGHPLGYERDDRGVEDHLHQTEHPNALVKNSVPTGYLEARAQEM